MISAAIEVTEDLIELQKIDFISMEKKQKAVRYVNDNIATISTFRESMKVYEITDHILAFHCG